MRPGGLKTFLFIDGYNLVHYWGYLDGGTSLEEARDRLIEELVELAHLSDDEVIVVFDAYKNRGRSTAVEEVRGLTVVYTRENQTADAYIEGRVKELASDIRYTVKVVTSDWVEQQVVMASGALRVTPAELGAEIERIVTRTKRRLAIEKRETEGKTGLPDKVRKTLEKWRNS
jgi:predicted RNA-binding protein with PIN domain